MLGDDIMVDDADAARADDRRPRASTAVRWSRCRSSRSRRSRPTAASASRRWPTASCACATSSRSRSPRRRRRTSRSWAATCSPRRSSRCSTETQPGVGGEIQLTDAIGAAARPQSRVRLRVHRGPLRHRQEARLPAGHRRARPRARRPREPTRAAAASTSCTTRVARAAEPCGPGPARGDPAAILAAVPRLPRRRRAPWPTRSGCVLAADVVAGEPVPPFANTAMDGYAVRAADTAGARPTRRCGSQVVGELPAGRAPSIAGRAGRGDPDHDRRADARRRRRGRDGRAHATRRRRRGAHRRGRRRRATTSGRPAATSRPARRCSRRAPCSGPRTSACWRSIGAATVARVPARAGRRALHRRRAGRSTAARSRPARSATRTARCSSRGRVTPAPTRRPRPRARRRGPRSSPCSSSVRDAATPSSRAAACPWATTTT